MIFIELIVFTSFIAHPIITYANFTAFITFYISFIFYVIKCANIFFIIILYNYYFIIIIKVTRSLLIFTALNKGVHLRLVIIKVLTAGGANFSPDRL